MDQKLGRLLFAGLMFLSPGIICAQDAETPADSDPEGTEEPSEAPEAPEVKGSFESEATEEEEAPAPPAEEPAPPPAEAEPVPEPVAKPAPVEPKADDSQKAKAEEPASTSSVRRRPSFFFGLGAGKVTDLGKYNHYSVLYGQEETMGLFHAGYYLFTYGVDFGLSTKFGYYHAEGNPLKSLEGIEAPLKEDLPEGREKDKNQKLELTLIPVQILVDLAYSPFPVSRRIVLRGWMGYEFLRVEESLSANISSSESTSSGSSLTSSGVNNGIVTGAMLSISLNGIEARSDYALKSLGIDRTFISPFFEIVKTTNEKMGNYDRKTYGLLINFEGLH